MDHPWETFPTRSPSSCRLPPSYLTACHRLAHSRPTRATLGLAPAGTPVEHTITKRNSDLTKLRLPDIQANRLFDVLMEI